MDDLISRKAAVAIADEARKIVAYELSCAGYDDAFVYASSDYMAKMAEMAVNRHTVTAAPAVKAKPLAWEVTDWSSGDGVKGENDCGWTAETSHPAWTYHIDFYGTYFRVTDSDVMRVDVKSLSAAKAAAQEDYETRILSALEVSQ